MERIVPIEGMTCAACETTVTTAALELPGVRAARADRRSGRLTLEGERLPADATLDAALADTPYRVGARPWLSRDHTVWRDVTVATAVVAALAMAAYAFGLDERIGTLTSGASAGSLALIALLGVAASVSTCMALVGGLVISLAASVGDDARRAARLRPHLAFNAGRVVGFAVLGGVVGWAGQGLQLSGTALAATMLVAALVMGVLGLRLTGASPRLAGWQLTLPGRWGTWARTGAGPSTVREDARAGDLRAAGLGAASFFLPCGFTQAVQVYALSTGSAAAGAAVMAVFALGTTPGLLAAGAAASAARRSSTGRALRVVGVVVVAFALVTGAGAVTTLAPGLGFGGLTPTERTANVADVRGAQEVTTVVEADGYSPEVSVVYAGENVRWRLEPEWVGCASLITAPSLGLDSIDVLTGPATVEFTAGEPGTYAYSCAMGMYTGAFVVIDRPEA